jgi:hypothetical protein
MKLGPAALSLALATLGLFAAGSACAQAPAPTPTASPTSISPDKQWQYVGGDNAKLVKAGTNETAVEFSCNGADSSVLVWAPDCMRFAITCAGGKGNSTSVYRLRNGKWETGDDALGNGDEIMDRAGDIIEAQAKKKGMPKKTFLHMNWWTVEPEKWIDSSTLVVYAAMREVAHRNDGSYAGASYGTDLLLTLKFDDRGAWKIIKTHEMSEKEVKQRESRAH